MSSSTPISHPKPFRDSTGAELRHDIRNILNQIIGYGEMSAQTAGEYGSGELARTLSEIVTIAKSILPILNTWRGPTADDEQSHEVGRLILTQSKRMNEIQAELLRHVYSIADAVFHEDLQRLNTATKNLVPLALQMDTRGKVGSDQAPVLVSEANSLPHAPSAAPSLHLSAKGLVLVADDGEDNRQLLMRYVEREGYSALCASNGRQALEMIRQYSFDVVLLDMIMPEIDGFGILSEIRRDPLLRDIAVIMISAVDDISKVARCIEVGADDYLAKPFNSVLLLARIRSSLERKRLRDLEKQRTGQLEKVLAEIENQKQVAEKLLRNILPEKVAEELREKGSVEPMYFEDVTILFVDFVNFTLSTEKLSAEELVQFLNEYFTAFDQIASSYGLEKLKTVGDSYMCASGLPVRNPAHPVDAVLAAYEIVDYVERAAAAGKGPGWRVRIGLHSGPVIAGVVGIRKFAFDIWGESVNLASRMESSGAPGRINLSARTYTRVKDFFACEHRGRVKTKDGNELDMYFVTALSPTLLTDQSNSPPPNFLRRYKTYFQKELVCFPACLTKS
jgi:class 3 adenylate cyclase/CheY-like chemotaxis protein